MVETTRFFYDVQVNFGHLAADNGAVAPIKTAFDIAAISESHLVKGNHYGDDKLEVDKTNLQTVIELLEESKIPYRINHHPEDVVSEWSIPWRGLFSDRAREICRVPEGYEPSYKNIYF